VADEIIQKNNFRIPKKLFTENQTGEKIGIFEARDETDEAQFIALRVKSWWRVGKRLPKLPCCIEQTSITSAGGSFPRFAYRTKCSAPNFSREKKSRTHWLHFRRSIRKT